MKLSISNIAWDASDDIAVYALMNKYGYHGLEIAPTRVFPITPYENLKEALEWSQKLTGEYGISVSSMQSIWYGRKEKLFGSKEEREELLVYTKKAIDFASVIGCKNLVFGCPRNRNVPENADINVAISFFRELGDYALAKGTVIGMEANPPIYNTNYINDTMSAINLIRAVDSLGFKLNLDVGTMIQNGETVDELYNQVKYINHVHISEPELRKIEKRDLHYQLCRVLREERYSGYISIEMGKTDRVAVVEETMQYIKEAFGNE